jgi:hypothetical protein
MEKILIWCGSVLVAVASAVAFIFTTFQTSAESEKTNHYFDQRLDRIEKKIDQLLK